MRIILFYIFYFNYFCQYDNEKYFLLYMEQQYNKMIKSARYFVK